MVGEAKSVVRFELSTDVMFNWYGPNVEGEVMEPSQRPVLLSWVRFVLASLCIAETWVTLALSVAFTVIFMVVFLRTGSG